METKVEEPRVEPKYEIDIFWSDEDDAFIAIVPDLPYCSAWGDTYESALKEVRAAIRGHLKVAKKYGDPIPEPKPHREAREPEQPEAGEASQPQAPSQIAEEPTGPARRSFQMLADRTVALQESNLRLTQTFFRNFMDQLQNQAQGISETAQNLRDQSQLQREAIETFYQGATNAYSEFLDSALSFYQETLSTATQVAQGNTPQAMEAADQASQQEAQSAIQAAQRDAEQAARETSSSSRSSS